MKGALPRKKPPEETNRKTSKKPEQAPSQTSVEVEAPVVPAAETIIPEVEKPKEKVKKPSRKVTIEEVEDSDDERDLGPPRQEFHRELPFRDVEPLGDVHRPEVLPPKPVEPAEKPREFGKRKPRGPRDTKVEDLANADILKSIRDTIVPVRLGSLIDSNPKIRKALETGTPKSRRPNFVQTTEGDVLAAKVNNFMARRVAAVDDDEPRTDLESSDEDSSVRLVETNLVTLDQDGNICQVLMFDTFPEIVTSSTHELEEGSIIVGDPVLQYFESLAEGETPKEITIPVAELSGLLRCLHPDIKGLIIEAITDCGSQIVSMSEEKAIELRLKWDPSMRILMQAANKQYQQTLGLARNVPFKFRGITLYLQVHILKNAPYEVLLGRPFEMLAETIFASKRNGDVEVTITDPYTGKQTTLATHPRGHLQKIKDQAAAKETKVVPQDF